MRQQHVDELDSYKGSNDPAETINYEIASKQRCRSHRPIPYASQSQRDQNDDNQRIENDRRQNCRLWGSQVHHVENIQLRKYPANIAGMIAKYLATSFATENVVSAPRVNQKLFADFDD